jgi:hypothetical protein
LTRYLGLGSGSNDPLPRLASPDAMYYYSVR